MANAGDVLNVSFIGYQTKHVTVPASLTINISLSKMAMELSDVVVSGFHDCEKAVMVGLYPPPLLKTWRMVSITTFEKSPSGKLSGV